MHAYTHWYWLQLKLDTILGFSIGQTDRRTKSNPVRNKCKHDESDDRLDGWEKKQIWTFWWSIVLVARGMMHHAVTRRRRHKGLGRHIQVALGNYRSWSVPTFTLQNAFGVSFWYDCMTCVLGNGSSEWYFFCFDPPQCITISSLTHPVLCRRMVLQGVLQEESERLSLCLALVKLHGQRECADLFRSRLT